MYLDTEKIAKDLWDRSTTAVEVDPAEFEEMFARAEPGWTPFEEPENYRWFWVENLPVKSLGVTLKKLMDKDAKDPGQEKFQHDRIVELLKKGAPEWPVFVTSTGIITDGYHRTAAHHTLKRKAINVVVSVPKPGELYTSHWDDLWNGAFPVR